MSNSKCQFDRTVYKRNADTGLRGLKVTKNPLNEIEYTSFFGEKEKSISLECNNQSSQRPEEWLPLPMPANESQTFYGLLAIYELSDNYVALYVDGTEDYQVDWGDGNVETVPAGTKAQHSYDYNSIPASTFYDFNKYRQVVVSVSMLNGGDMTEFSLDQIHDNAYYSATPWLDINLNAHNVTTLAISPDNDTLLPMLQRAGLYQMRSVTSFEELFTYCFHLSHVEITETDSLTNCRYMFNYARFKSISLFNTSNVTDMSYMFSDCYFLEEIPEFDTSSVTSMASMFASCFSLKSVPSLNTPNLQDMNSMFIYCYSLEQVPLFDTSNVQYIDFAFAKCISLKQLPEFDFSSVGQLQYTFDQCYALKDIPLFDFSSVTFINHPFTDCRSIKTIPQFDFSSVVEFNYLLTGCDSLEYVPALNFSSAIIPGIVVNSSRPKNVIVDDIQFSTTPTAYNIQFLGVSRVMSTSLAGTNVTITGPMHRPALLELFNNLGLGGGKNLNISGCEGKVELSPADIAIATGKNWTVIL